ncbi:MAG: hypothetical protein KGI50_01455 [Patescibacteria group bacterium]|nr:hypothetical protein [Patescibacteria group bacterium]MDE2437988.1 hypothetical protein [Patescibacteria group bacterium]
MNMPLWFRIVFTFLILVCMLNFVGDVAQRMDGPVPPSIVYRPRVIPRAMHKGLFPLEPTVAYNQIFKLGSLDEFFDRAYDSVLLSQRGGALMLCGLKNGMYRIAEYNVPDAYASHAELHYYVTDRHEIIIYFTKLGWIGLIVQFAVILLMGFLLLLLWQ